MKTEALEIIPYSKQYKQAFVDLNIEWLEALFYVEDHDREILNACEETILAPGGFIFFARLGEQIVGCYALLKMKDGVFELGKMAVAKNFRGHKIGQKLMEHCVAFGKEQNWEKMVLYSSLKLHNALHIYRKFGFVQIPLEKDSPYQRSSIKMELVFDKTS